MAGGLFDDQPFSLNPKCIVFTLVMAAGYWYLPSKNTRVLVALLYFPYLALAWYDHVYECKYQLQPTLFPFGRFVYLPVKPPEYQQKYEALPTAQKNTMSRFDRLLVAILLGVALVWASGSTKK